MAGFDEDWGRGYSMQYPIPIKVLMRSLPSFAQVGDVYLNAVWRFLIPRVQLGFKCAVGDDGPLASNKICKTLNSLRDRVNQFAIAMHGVPSISMLKSPRDSTFTFALPDKRRITARSRASSSSKSNGLTNNRPHPCPDRRFDRQWCHSGQHDNGGVAPANRIL